MWMLKAAQACLSTESFIARILLSRRGVIHLCSTPQCSIRSPSDLGICLVNALLGSSLFFRMSLPVYRGGLTSGVSVQPGVWVRKEVQDGLAHSLVKMSDMISSWTFWMPSLEHSKCQHCNRGL